MAFLKEMRSPGDFRANASRRRPSSARRILRILLPLFLLSLACTVPLAAPAIDLPTPEPIIWWTNTPSLELPDPTTEPTTEPTLMLPSPTLPPTATTPPDTIVLDNTPYLYEAQAGDTLYSLSVRFSVLPGEIESDEPFSETGLLPPGQVFIIPRRLANITTSAKILPDSEVIHSISASLFDAEAYISQAGGYLNTYSEFLNTTGSTSGANIIKRVSLENSINPRLLLALLQYQAGWVFGQPPTSSLKNFPMGWTDPNREGLYEQLTWTINFLSTGYYGWREGQITDLVFKDGVRARLSPDLNAGTVAIMYYFSQIFDSGTWLNAIDPETGFIALHVNMFGDPWERAALAEPLFPPTLKQPEMILPFARNDKWSYSGGPHGAWSRIGARAAVDFAPPSQTSGCVPSDRWVTAAAPGLVVRSSPGVLVLDMDGDANESTGWVLVYLHLATEGKLEEGTWVTTGQFLGNPSCEGGFSTGTHIHIARKYNGEWMLAGGPVPFNLNGWIVEAGAAPYEGTLIRGGEVIIASPLGIASSLVGRDD